MASGKRVSLASLAGSKVEVVPGASRPELIHVPPAAVAPTPLNPRRAFDETELVELGEDMRGGQLQPCVAVTKSSYVKLYPEHAELLPEGCRYVMAAGERRWRAAVKVGLDTLDLMLRHDLTESRVRFLAAVLSENVQRANFNPIEEADGLRAMLDLHDGNQAAAARAMGKSKGWFNQRIGLLRLTDEMVQLVLEGKLTALRDMRRYAAMPPEDQYAAWKADQEKPAVPSKPQLPAETVPEPEAYTAVHTSSAPAPAEPESFTAVKHDDPAQGTVTQPSPKDRDSSTPRKEHALEAPGRQPTRQEAPAVPAQPSKPVAPSAATDTANRPSGTPFPYQDGVFAGQCLIHRMPAEELEKCYEVLTQHRAKHSVSTG
jgi:ParB family chromosome partitioning protein